MPFALDYVAVMGMGEALDADRDMLADVMPAAEAAIISQFAAGDEGQGSE